MKHIGKRREPTLSAAASGKLLAEGALFNESIARIAPSTFMRKGVYRFKSHEDANRHAEDCLVQGMARLAAGRR